MNNLRELRINAGYSGKEFAEMLGVAPQTLSGYENGDREPNIDKLKKISKILHCSIDELVGNEKEEK